jgi:hypothetical protein
MSINALDPTISASLAQQIYQGIPTTAWASKSTLGAVGATQDVGPNSSYVCGPAGRGLCAAQLGAEWAWQADTGCQNAHGTFTCARTVNSASEQACCLGQATASGQTCSSTLGPSNGTTCNTYWQQYCAGTQQINPATGVYANVPGILMPDCQAWLKAQPTAGASLMQAAAGASSGHMLFCPVARNWCISNPGKCDQAAAAYCKLTGANAGFCACLNSTTLKANCFDSACMSSGYQTAAMTIDQTCPTLQQCISTYNISGSANTLSQNQMIQNCISGTAPAATPAPAAPAVPAATPPASTSEPPTPAPAGSSIVSPTNPSTPTPAPLVVPAVTSPPPAPSADAPTSLPAFTSSDYIIGGIAFFVVFIVIVVLVLVFRRGSPQQAQWGPGMPMYGPQMAYQSA